MVFLIAPGTTKNSVTSSAKLLIRSTCRISKTSLNNQLSTIVLPRAKTALSNIGRGRQRPSPPITSTQRGFLHHGPGARDPTSSGRRIQTFLEDTGPSCLCKVDCYSPPGCSLLAVIVSSSSQAPNISPPPATCKDQASRTPLL